METRLPLGDQFFSGATTEKSRETDCQNVALYEISLILKHRARFLEQFQHPKKIGLLIAQHYDEMIRYATALRLGTAEAEAILQRFTRHGVQHPTYKALVELGRAVKTIFLAEYLHSLELRREIHEGLNVVENWNSANSFIFYGRSSEISTNDRQSQEISVLALHLLQVCLVYVNTLMIQQILAQPGWQNRLEIEDLRALSPLLYAHVNPYGRFELNMSTRLRLD